MTDTFGKAITSQYIGGIYASLGDLGESLTAAADGAGSLADGASGLSSGLAQYTGGVGDLSDGLYQLDDGASELASGVTGYTGGVSQLSDSLAQLNQGIQPNPAVDPAIKAGLQQVVDGLAGAASNGPALASGATQLSDGVSQSVDGAAQLSANGPALVSGAAQLSSGATDLATGLRDGASKLTGADTPAGDPEIAADPVTLSVTTDNEVSQVGQLVATFFVPLGLWIGALAVFLVLRPLTRRALASTARNGRLVFAGLARAGAVTGAQAVLLTVLLHAGLGVSWSLLPATLGLLAAHGVRVHGVPLPAHDRPRPGGAGRVVVRARGAGDVDGRHLPGGGAVGAVPGDQSVAAAHLGGGRHAGDHRGRQRRRGGRGIPRARRVRRGQCARGAARDPSNATCRSARSGAATG